MSNLLLSDPAYTRDLGDNLVLRWSSAADCERIGVLYSHVFRGAATDAPNTHIASWARELMSGDHPLITAGDFAIVEDTASGAVVAATCLMRQTWEYGGIALPVGRPEIVASLREYRNRGLIRAIFTLIHARSDARGDMAQGITGIEYYYRQFGYEYALDLDGGKAMPFANIPPLKDGEAELYSLRDATEVDLPQLQALYDRERNRKHDHTPLLVSTRIDASYWQFRLRNTWRETGEGWLNKLLIDQVGRVVGYSLIGPIRSGDTIYVPAAMVDEGVSLLAVMPALLRALQAEAARIMTRKADTPAAAKLYFGFGRAHPLYDALGTLVTSHDPVYAWYVRVADLSGFIRRVAPVLEARLAASIAAGHTGELRLTFYRGGLRLAFEGGRLVAAEPWQRDHNWGPKADAGFPPLVFLQLLFGHRSLDELRGAFPDVSVQDDAKKLLDILFPRTQSWVLHLD